MARSHHQRTTIETSNASNCHKRAPNEPRAEQMADNKSSLDSLSQSANRGNKETRSQPKAIVPSTSTHLPQRVILSTRTMLSLIMLWLLVEAAAGASELLVRAGGQRATKPVAEPELAHSRHRAPHVYNIRAQANGKLLAAPLRVNPDERMLSGSPARLAELSSAAEPSEPEVPFGARTSTQRMQAESSSSAADEHSSISTSSQMLRFTSQPERAPQLLGAQPSSPATFVPARASTLEPELERRANKQPVRVETDAVVSAGELQESSEPAGAGKLASGDSILGLIDEFDSKISTIRTKAQLSCDSGEMVLRLNFSDPFKGIVYPEHNRLSPCRFFGDGHRNYELRLPLRGCGTRQAVPRVFVNDVIVRFHKTLELEEDEVKTLICRYPPPLAPVPIQVAPDRPGHSATELEGPAQFELFEPHAARPFKPEPPDSSGTIETLSENLVVAPHAGHHLGPSLNAYTGRPLVPTRPRDHSADLLEARDSTSQSGTTSNFLERLSSIELLFLISSVMFLLLLALGLASSYYCFRRQSQRASSRRASSILKHRGRRFASPPASTTLQHTHLRQVPTGKPQLNASSSPESDLSARGLLAGSAGSYSVGRRPTGAPYMYNPAFVPDLPTYAPHFGATQFSSNLLSDHSRGHHNQLGQFQHSIKPFPPAVGRRDSSNINDSIPSDGRATYGRQPRHLWAQNRVRESAQAKHLVRLQEPLLLLADQQDQSAVIGRSSRAPPTHRQQPDTRSLVSAKYAIVTKLPPHVPPDKLRQRPPDHKYIQAPGVWRASSGNLLEPERQRTDLVRPPSSRNIRHFQDDLSSSTCSDSELETINGSHQEPELRSKPKMLLKSIEDTTITNYTEIHKQEFMKRNSMRPLSLGQWRAHCLELSGDAKPTEAVNSSKLLSELDTDDDDDDDDYGHDSVREGQKHLTGKTRLRSLSELDVNFARAMPSEPRATGSVERLANSEPEGTTEPMTPSRARRPSSVSGRVEISKQTEDGANNCHSPDLILSPDYDHGHSTRLQLKPANSPGGSFDNSVSYV